eukprot:s2692_g2.t1
MLPTLELAKSRTVLAEVPSMPLFGLIGDSSLYCKSSKKRVKRIGCQLQEELATNDLWYHAVANAGVEKMLQMLTDTPLKFGTLGISYFGNDIIYGKIRPQVRAAWKDLIDLVEEKADRVVFVGGKLQEVRQALEADLPELCATWAELLSPPRRSMRNESSFKRCRDYGARNEHPQQWGRTADNRSAGDAREHNGSSWSMRRGGCDHYENGSSNSSRYWRNDSWSRRDDNSSCKRRKVDDARNEHPQPWGWTADNRSAGDAREHNGSSWSMRRGGWDYRENGSSNSCWPDDGSRYWRNDSDSSMKRRRLDDDRAYSLAAAKPW